MTPKQMPYFIVLRRTVVINHVVMVTCASSMRYLCVIIRNVEIRQNLLRTERPNRAEACLHNVSFQHLLFNHM